ncbi:condensation domain-containing protein [Kitasatospora mediocidica]|uniref:condensation domain-containing protein n=1 Tax=Kitasatospora mediocidica TaxID=58352 RepID=UPI00055AE574|nr:condensation domain-containing protein [Kitasatospora mediocidica]
MAEETLAVITSFAQQSLWLQNQIDPGRSAYNVVAGVRLRGRLDVPALTSALNAVMDRHEALRTVFRLDRGVPVQVIGPVAPLEIPVAEVREDQVDDLVQQEIESPFDLATGPLLRLRLLRLSAEHHIAVLVMHHIITDGESSEILLRELLLHYAAERAGESLELPELPIQYADFAVWQRETLRAGYLGRLKAYWSERLTGAAPLTLPAAPPTANGTAPRGATYRFTVPGALREGLETLARERNATLFMALLAGFDVLLARHCRQDDITVLSPVSGRHRSELEGLIGYFVNPLLLRVDLSGDPGALEVLDRVQATCLGAYDHQELPFEQAVNLAGRPGASRERAPLDQVMMVLQSTRPDHWQVADLRFEPVPVGMGAAKAALLLDLRPDANGLHGVLEYDADRFDAAAVAGMADDLLAVWAWLAERSALPLSRVPGLSGPSAARATEQPAAPSGPAAQAAVPVPYVAPRTPLEEEVARIWAELLELERVGVYDNFFDLGGQSLTAVRLTARLRDEFGLDLAVRQLYGNFTVEEVAWRALQQLAAEGDLDEDAPSPA